MACEGCSPGSSSGGDRVVYDRWNEWPAQLSTHCAIGAGGVFCNKVGWMVRIGGGGGGEMFGEGEKKTGNRYILEDGQEWWV